jgi:pectin methylesterase-like acyl-CoA thioesterase
LAADGYTNLEHYLNAIVSEITAGQNDGGTMLGDGAETTGGGAAANAEVKGKAVKATWAFNLGEGGQTATLAPEAANAYFKTSYEQHGASLIYKGTGKADNTDFAQTKFQPSQQDGSANADNFIDFVIVPKTGLKFTPTKVTFNSTRWGTGGGNIDYAWFSSDGSTVSLEKKVKPERNNVAPYVSTFSSIVSGATASDGPCGLRINLYDLAANKQISFANVVIEGTLSGTVQNVEQKRVKVSVNPADAGKVSIMPKGDSFDVGTEVTLSQTRSFGYKFVGWTDAKGNVLSADDDYKFPLNEDAEITANYTAIPTYALSAGVDGANDYMVQVSPAANVVGGKNMYEEGAKVTLIASSNPVLAFSNWSNGLTSSEIEVEMTKDVNLTAIYSKTKDYIVGWDFYKEGNSPRTSDFASTDNDTRTLAMLNAEGNIASWLDKAHSKGGYEGRDAAVCWVNNAPIGSCYWQTSFSAEAFTDIRVKSAMAYNYNAHKAYNIEYSLDGTSWKKIGTVEMDGAKNWKDTEFALPSDADNKELVYLRWIADMSSAVDGAESSNDGAAISSIYVYGKEKIVNDGIAPKLISTVPTDGAEGVSINGKIVLTFDEKVKVADGAKASINGKELDVAASGKTVVCEYKGLAYSESYAFDLPAAVVSDLAGNAVAEPIDFSFTTRTRPTVAKARYDFIVPTDGSFKDALAMANKRADTSKRFRIFVKKGTYVTPSDETKKVRGGDGVDYPDPKTYLNAPNVSIIGEDIDATVISNNPPAATWDNGYGKACPIEGLRNCDVLQIGSGATRTYMQDITLKNGTADGTGRNCALTDQSDKTICKNVGLYGYQDTYLSNNQNGRFYFEGGKLRGRTDFLCGKGDVYYNNLDLIVCEAGAKIAVPSQGRKYGYVFEGCTIKAEDGKKGIDGNFTLGRPWGKGTPIAVYLNTIMEAQPSIAGWDEMSGGYPALFAEYNSMNKNGSKIDLKGRKGSYDAYDSHNGNNYKNRRVETSVTVLTDEEAARYTLANVMGDGDGWDPSADTEQASAPQHVLLNGNTLSWTNSDYVLCWAVCKDGNVVGFTTEPVYTVDNARASWSVRAANEMGGLGEATIATPTSASGINTIAADAAVTVVEYYSVSGTRVPATTLGVIVRIAYHADGTKSVSKVINK